MHNPSREPAALSSLAGEPDERELRQLAARLLQAYAMGSEHETRPEEIRQQLLAAHQQLQQTRWAGVVATDLGWVGLVWSARGVCRLTFPRPDREEALAALHEANPGTLQEEVPEALSHAVRSCCHGEPLAALPVFDLSALPEFRRRVLELALSIPHGQTRSYRWIGEQLGIRSYQAVGQALGANPIPILIPCHRVVASDGSLRGYLGGLELKQRLLDLERARRQGGAL